MRSLHKKLSSTRLGCGESCVVDGWQNEWHCGELILITVESIQFTNGLTASAVYVKRASSFRRAFYAFSELSGKYLDENPRTDVARVLENRLER